VRCRRFTEEQIIRVLNEDEAGVLARDAVVASNIRKVHLP